MTRSELLRQIPKDAHIDLETSTVVRGMFITGESLHCIADYIDELEGRLSSDEDKQE